MISVLILDINEAKENETKENVSKETVSKKLHTCPLPQAEDRDPRLFLLRKGLLSSTCPIPAIILQVLFLTGRSVWIFRQPVPLTVMYCASPGGFSPLTNMSFWLP